jgi:hypothetical protein
MVILFEAFRKSTASICRIAEMKFLPPTLAVLFAVVPLSTRAQQSSPEEFIAAYKTAMQEKSVDKLKALTYSVGVNESDKSQVNSSAPSIFNDREIGRISLEPLPPDYKLVSFWNGKKFEPTYPPVGMIKIQYKEAAPGAPSSYWRPYAIINGNYFLVATKSTDVPMKTYPLGPGSDSPDNEYHFVVVKQGNVGFETLSYGLVKFSTGQIVGMFPCAYKFEGNDDSWPLQNAQAAQVYWSKDSKWFVLDEENYRFMGNTTLGTISESNNGVTYRTFTPSDLQMRGLANWRIRVDKGWITPTTLSLEISGVYGSTASAPETQFTQNFTCEVNDVMHCRFVKTQ